MTVPNDRGDATGPPASERLPPLPRHLDPRRGVGHSGGAVPPRAADGRPGAARGQAPAARGRRRGARVLSWVAVVTSITLLAVAGGGYALVNHYDGNINRIDVFGGGLAERPAAGPRNARNILIVGSDDRGDDEPGTGTQGVGKGFVSGQRSDTIILAHLYGSSDQAQLVSLPRDSYVTIPEHLGPNGKVVPERKSRINTAFSEGGPALLVQTVEKLTGLYIDNYLQIDFNGFRALVDTLGGVEVCLSKPAKEPKSGINLRAGRQIVQGEQALAFVRQRDGLPRGDLDRIDRQQQFIGAIVRKTLSAGTLLNVFKLNGVIEAGTRSLRADKDLSIGELRDLALRFKNFDAGGVLFSTVPVANPAARIGGASVVLLDEPAAARLFDQLSRDIPPAPPAPAQEPGADPTPSIVVAPADVRVKVLNGAGVQGLGRRAYDDLEAVGFQVVGQPENRPGATTATVVFHGPGQADAARTVVAALPGATARLNPALTRTLEVVIGSAYSGAKPVSAGGASRPPAPASPPPEVRTAAQDPCAA